MEALEDRTLLNASIDIDAAALLTYFGESAAVENLQVSVAGNIYTFASNRAIDVTTNTAGLVVTGSGTQTVTVTGITGLIVATDFSNSSVGVQSTNVPTTIAVGVGDASVTLGAAGVTAGVASPVTVANGSGGSVSVAVDDHSGATGDAWNLKAQASPSTKAELTGLSATGSLIYDPAGIDELNLAAASNRANTLTVDFSDGSPLPAHGANSAFTYNGGFSSGGPTSDLVLAGAPPSGPIGAETHVVTGQGAGGIELGAAGAISYGGLSAHSVYDVLPAVDYTLNALLDPDGRVLIGAGVNSPLTGGAQSLLISSQAASPTFSDTYVANKTNVVVNLGSAAAAPQATVDYGAAAPVAGLSKLAVNSGANPDSVNLAALPPGATTTVDQGAGDDQAYVAVQGTVPAAGTSLDGGVGNNTLNLDAGGLAITAGNFAAGPGGSTTISGAPLTGQPITYANYQHVNVTNLAAAAPVVSASTIHAVRGQRQSDVVAGTFTSAAPGARASDFLATIQWGDGGQSAGTIVQDASNPSIFYVMGTHTYYESNASLTTHVIVASLGGTATQIINGVPVAFTNAASAPVTGDGTAAVGAAAINVTTAWFSGVENVAPSPADVLAGWFVDQGGVNPTDADPAARYSVLINWGDGSAPLPVAPSGIVQNGTSNSFTVTVPQHVYSTPGVYVVTMTVSIGGANGVASSSTGVAYVADAPLSPAAMQPLIAPAASGVQLADAALASFTDGNPLSKPGDFKVLIDWGDGSPMSSGSLTQPGGAGTAYTVAGTHTYMSALAPGAAPASPGVGPVAGPVTSSGTYPIRVYVQDVYGSSVNLSNAIAVKDAPLNVVGGLNPASDSGVSNSDGITNVVQPTFQGWTSHGGAMVYVYATPAGGSPMLIGRTASDANGAWSVASTSALADGGYTIEAQAYDAGGHTISALTPIGPPLVVDTVGPKVTDLSFDSLGGRVIATFQDFGGVDNAGVGLNQSTLIDAANYQFALMKAAPIRGYRPPARWLVNAITVQPGGLVGPQTAAIQINDGRGIRGGRYQFTARSAGPADLTGIQDVAGNALDGEFYGYFPSGNNHVGGDFVAGLDVLHHRIFAPNTTVGAATPVTPPGVRGVDRFISRPGRPLPRAAAAVKLSAARATASARPATLRHG